MSSTDLGLSIRPSRTGRSVHDYGWLVSIVQHLPLAVVSASSGAADRPDANVRTTVPSTGCCMAGTDTAATSVSHV